MTRIFVAGFHHETNTFAPSVADWAAFETGSGYPPFLRGAAMLEAHRAGPLALAGFAAEADRRGWTLLPSAWAGAMPSNRITRDAFERIAGTIADDLREALRDGVDALFLDLHGAAVAEGCDDAEGELLARLRALAGPARPIVVSLDLHANLSAAMLRHASALTAYRTYPHVDMRETGARAAAMLARRLAGASGGWHTAARRVHFLLPLNAQCTLVEPAASVMARLAALEARHGLELGFAMGFSAADIADCGPVLFGHGRDAAALQAALDELHEEVTGRRREWAVPLLAPAEAVERALALAAGAGRPVLIADTQDNPGAGGDANTTGLLHALLAARAGERLGGAVALGLLFDPEAARAACAAGVGARLALSIGRAVPTWGGALSDPPVQAEVRVQAVHDGELHLHGPMTDGLHARLGPCARVELGGVQVLLASAKMQMLDADLFRFLGVEPARMKLLVLKSSVHFRAAFAPLAGPILVAKAPGPMAADPGELPWTALDPRTAVRP